MVVERVAHWVAWAIPFGTVDDGLFRESELSDDTLQPRSKPQCRQVTSQISSSAGLTGM